MKRAPWRVKCNLESSMSTTKASRAVFPRLACERGPLRALILSAFLVLPICGCRKDPAVQKRKFLEQGNASFAQAKYPEALIFYGRALQLDAKFAEAHYRMALTQMKLGSWLAAYRELSRAAELEPQNSAVQQELAQLELAGGKPQQAKDRALVILRQEPKNADAEMLLSNADAALGHMKEALEEAKEATAMAPERSLVFLNLGQIQARMNDVRAAEESFKKAQSLDPHSAAPHMVLAKFYEQNQRSADSEREFKAAIEAAPKDVSARAALAALYFSQGQVSEAEQVLIAAKQQLASDPTAYRLLGDSYIGRGQYGKALSEFALLTAAHPDDLAARKTYIQLLILNNRIDEADSQNQEVLKKSPQDPEALVLKGEIELHQNHTEQAINTLEQALKGAPDNAFGHYQLGVAFQQQDNSQQAESEWRQAVRLHPSLAEAWIALGASATKRADWRALEEISDQLRKVSPHSIDAYLFHARARFNLGDTAGAEADLNHVIELAPERPTGYIELGFLRTSQKRFSEAQALFHKALAWDPGSADAMKGLATVYLAENKPADALHFLEEQIDHNRNSSPLFLYQGQVLLETKQYEPAEAALAHAVELDQKNLAAWLLLAQTHASLKKFDQAIADYQRAIALSPHNASLFVALGVVYEKKRDWQQASENYRKALALKPDEPLAANNLAYLLLEHSGDVNVALSLAQTGRKGLPNLPNSADTLGWAYYRTGAYSAAAPLLETAVKAAPDNQSYRYHLGVTYEKLKNSARAKAELEKAISLDPKSPVADEARQAISELAPS